MDQSKEHIQHLWERYLADKASRAELAQLFEHIQNSGNDEANQLMSAEIARALESGLPPAQPQELSAIWEGVLAARNNATPIRRIPLLRRWWWVAASILFVIGLGAYFWRNVHNTSSTVDTTVQHDVPPGKDGAILTLADGRQVVLDSMANGIVATQNGSEVILTDGQITYDPNGKATGATVYNTVTTPKGREFHIMLPDGSKVWLNAASSITYPVSFTGKKRPVTISGEVYFEVVKNASKPFLVDAGGKASVQVLGTHFNINAYTNEGSIKTTLLEGSVKVMDRQTVILKPGEQAVSTDNARLTVHHNVDIDQVMAWKNGLFDFEGANVETVMRILERWYDITVQYEGAIPNKYFHGQLDRGVNLSEIIRILPELGIQCQLKGRTLIVY